MEDYKMTNVGNYDTMDKRIQNILEEYNMIDNHKTWAVPEYSKNQINKAGKTLSLSDIPLKEKNEALLILNNWRASHGYPLQEIYNILKEINPDAIVAQRLKRLNSIVGKLKRFENMSLYRIQDLGGCRVIVKDIKEIYQAVEIFKNYIVLNTKFELKRENDYIKNPKKSGYRSYHLVYKYHSDKNETYNKNILIEIQFRTKLQHIWATAVEMMAISTKSNLKASQGNEDILRFFTLVSSLFAIEEHTSICPNTSNDENELLKEINDLNQKHHIMDTLNALSTTIKYNYKSTNNKMEYYILDLHYIEKYVNVYGYPKDNIEQATFVYNQLESSATNDENIVLVSADSLDSLKLAYPNYFADIRKFITVLNKYNAKFTQSH